MLAEFVAFFRRDQPLENAAKISVRSLLKLNGEGFPHGTPTRPANVS